jgi:hypothetical protein
MRNRHWASLAMVTMLAPAAWGQRVDPSKREVVEKPIAAVAAGSRNVDPNNPAVKPGDVRWHASFDAARDASRRSGKPVLLFHLLGRLDQQFC